MAQKATKKIGNYRLYKVEGYGHYEIYSGTKAKGVHVENIAHVENFEWAIQQINARFDRESREEFGIGVA